MKLIFCKHDSAYFYWRQWQTLATPYISDFCDGDGCEIAMSRMAVITNAWDESWDEL
jgi:hypothetical protein